MRPATSFTVHGIPAPQGSKNPWGGEANKRTKPWRDAVAQVAGECWQGAELLRGPVFVQAEFYFPRPKAHFRTGKNSAMLRQDAPFYHSSPNDLDKLCRAIGDALTGVIYADDKQIAVWHASKVYGHAGYVRINIIDLSGGSSDDADSTQAGPGSVGPHREADQRVPGTLRG